MSVTRIRLLAGAVLVMGLLALSPKAAWAQQYCGETCSSCTGICTNGGCYTICCSWVNGAYQGCSSTCVLGC